MTFEIMLATASGLQLKISGDSGWPLVCVVGLIGATIVFSKMEDGKTARAQLQLALIERRQQERNDFEHDNRLQPEDIHNDFYRDVEE